MSRNLLVFLDGTGNEGGLLPDESRTNVYKLYRASRVGPDTTIDPDEQIAFYVPGVGTTGGKQSFMSSVRSVVRQGLGIGLTAQVANGLAAIIGSWQPEDRIFLFGFSRGAYAARCLAHVLEIVGIPTRLPDGSGMKLDPGTIKPLARQMVKLLYRGGLPRRNEPNRNRLAGNFETSAACVKGLKNGALPYCICIWDSVAAVGWRSSIIAWAAKYFLGEYDRHFPPEIPFARHALAIDEYRSDFVRVPWGGKATSMAAIDGVARFRQIWFAGNHADIGGSYPENESRLSDISLEYMSDFVSKRLPEGTRVKIDSNYLRLHPSPFGMMHDQLMVGMTKANIRLWRATIRLVPDEATLHESVYQRLRAPTVRNYIGYGNYRPEGLREHHKSREFY